jgi:hypothetical protein
VYKEKEGSIDLLSGGSRYALQQRDARSGHAIRSVAAIETYYRRWISLGSMAEAQRRILVGPDIAIIREFSLLAILIELEIHLIQWRQTCQTNITLAGVAS